MTCDISEITAHPGFVAATAALRAQHDRLIDEIIQLTEIPAPPFKEDRRAAAFRDMLAAHGLEDVQIDEVGNVTGIRRGKGNGQMVAIAAHLDTVFPEGTDVTVRREGNMLYAPGVGDDTRGLAVLLAFARALDTGEINTERDILFVADVGEEGKGDLRGIRHLFTDGAYAERIGAFFTLDGPEVEPVITRAVGSHRYRVHFRGPGGHSFGAFGTVNPAHALADLVAGMARWSVPSDPKTTFCASVFGGGSSINAIPEDAWVEIDLRSVDPDALNRLDSDLHRLVAAAVEAENTRGDTTHGEIVVQAARLGARPAGTTPDDAPIVTACRDALAAFGFTMRPGTASTDANIPMSLGVPAVKIGTGGRSGRAHTLDEWIDVEPELSLRGLNASLASILGVAGVVA